MAEIVDETLEPRDPRFRLYYPAKQHYLPWYYRSADDAKEDAARFCAACGSEDAPHVGHDDKRLCGGCLSQCIDM